MHILKLLVDGGADVNAKTADGDTPLHSAAAWRSVEMDGVEQMVAAEERNGITGFRNRPEKDWKGEKQYTLFGTQRGDVANFADGQYQREAD